MQSTADRNFTLPAFVACPVSVLPSRRLRVSFPLPSPLLRVLGPSEQPVDALWSNWLAEWGWTWAVSQDKCIPEMPLVNLWLDRNSWPPGFDARVLALAVALKLRVDGETISSASRAIESDLDRVWRAISALSQEVLGEVLALAMLRADANIFHFDSVAPSWPADVGQVIAERRSLSIDREPAPIWLKSGYELLGEAFSMVRSMGTSLKDCEEVWDAFAKDHEQPLAYKMAFWWEATYCLTECHAYSAAESAQAKVAIFAQMLEGFTGLIDPMWHHQQGRLFFYAGNHELALTEFLREFKAHGEDLKLAAMLNREIANVLSDLACLDAAKQFAERSVSVARSQGQRTELYKSLGRLAEITLKTGNLDSAYELNAESLSIQQKIGDSRAPAQTLTYLGHIALLRCNPEQAAEYYAQATAKDSDESSAPYVAMGRFSIAVSLRNTVELDQLWNAHREKILFWSEHPTHVLPAAVCTLAASRSNRQAKESLHSVVRALIDSNYAIEALWAVSELPEDIQEPLLRDIVAILNRWHKNLAAVPPEFREIAGHLNGPSMLIEAVRTRQDMHANQRLRLLSYPMNLAIQ